MRKLVDWLNTCERPDEIKKSWLPLAGKREMGGDADARRYSVSDLINVVM